MKISVALCTYNGEKYLKEQLDSILSQSVLPDEIVVCDDVSQDSTFDILQQYKNQYPEIFKIERNKENLGYVKNFEKAIMMCSGNLIFLSDQDDIWFENKVESIRNALSENPNINVICHNIELFSESNIPEKDYWKARKFYPQKTNAELLEFVFLSGNIFPGMTMAISKKAKDLYFPLKKLNHLIIHDFELIIQACRDGSFYVTNEILAKYRLHENQNIGFNTDYVEKNISIVSLHTKYKSVEYNNQIIKEFQLPSELSDKYQNLLKRDTEQYINQYPRWKRPYIRLKLKYYFKLNLNS